MRPAGDSPSRPMLRRARSALVDRAVAQLDADDRVLGVLLVGSLGRGDADDWSDVDLLFLVDDPVLDDFQHPESFACSDEAALTFDARQNSPAGTHAMSGQYVIDDLPLWVDWYAFPLSKAVRPTDSIVLLDRVGLPAPATSFDEHLANRVHQDPTLKPPQAHELMRMALVPMAGQRIARRSPDAASMIQWLGAPRPVSDAPLDQVRSLRQLLDAQAERGHARSFDAGHRYLDLVESVL